MGILFHPFVVPLAAFVFVFVITAICCLGKMREKELETHTTLRARQLDHELRLKEMELQQAKLELEKARCQQHA